MRKWRKNTTTASAATPGVVDGVLYAGTGPFGVHSKPTVANGLLYVVSDKTYALDMIAGNPLTTAN